MNIDNLLGIRTRKKWTYNNLGEKIDYIEEVYIIEETGDDKIEH